MCGGGLETNEEKNEKERERESEIEIEIEFEIEIERERYLIGWPVGRPFRSSTCLPFLRTAITPTAMST